MPTFQASALDPSASPDVVFTIDKRIGLKARGLLSWAAKKLATRAVSGDSGNRAIDVGEWRGTSFQERSGDAPYCDANGLGWFSVFADAHGRTGIGLHPDGGTPDATKGCIGLAVPDTQAWHDALAAVSGCVVVRVQESAMGVGVEQPDNVREMF